MPGLEPVLGAEEQRVEDFEETHDSRERMVSEHDAEAKLASGSESVEEQRKQRTVFVRVEGSDNDVARVYRFSEATQIGAHYQKWC